MTLITRLSTALRARHYSRRTEEAYGGWVKRFVRANGMRHPRELGPAEVSAFLSDLAVASNVSAATQMQAMAALLFLYREVIGRDLGRLEGVRPARRATRLPVVLTRIEVRPVIGEMGGVTRLIAGLLYASGLRLLECLSLRIKDVDFAMGQIMVRGGRVTGTGSRCSRPHFVVTSRRTLCESAACSRGT